MQRPAALMQPYLDETREEAVSNIIFVVQDGERAVKDKAPGMERGCTGCAKARPAVQDLRRVDMFSLNSGTFVSCLASCSYRKV